MSDDPRVNELLAPLRSDGPELEAHRPAIDRDRVLARMAAAAKSAPLERGRRTKKLAGLALAAALAATLGLAAVRALVAPATTARTLDVTVVSGQVAVQGAAPRNIAAGPSTRVSAEGVLTTPPGTEARIRTESGIELDVLENTRLPLADLEPRASALHLAAGSIRCHVPRLSAGQAFSVVTPDATVIVHGTVFSVEVRADGSATNTTVRVDEGVVAVRHATGEVTLTASQSWTHRPAPPVVGRESTPAETGPGAVGETPARSPNAPRPGARKGAEPQVSGPGTLDDETRLLRTGLAAERNGDLAAAATSFEQLLSRYPQSPLVPDARAALARVRTRHGTQMP